MRGLSARDQLALIMTGATSLRAAARELGVSHQKLGRWLREGEPGGVKAIPKDTFTRAAIAAAYSEHADRAREHARALGAPLPPGLPAVMIERRELQDAEGRPYKSDRLRIQGAQYLGDDLRRRLIEGAQRSGRYAAVSVRSVVSIIDYFRAKLLAQQAAGQLRNYTPARVEKEARKIARDFARQRTAQDGEFVRANMAMFTQSEPLRPGADPELAASSVAEKLRAKHEPATHGEAGALPGTVLGDLISLQLMPAPTAREQRQERERTRERVRSRARRDQVKGRGNK